MSAKAIAEFVHSKDVQTIVEELDIEYSQGYYFGKPKAFLEPFWLDYQYMSLS